MIATGIVMLFLSMALPANAAVTINKEDIETVTQKTTGFFQQGILMGEIKGKMKVTKTYRGPEDSGFLLIEGKSVAEPKELYGISVESLRCKINIEFFCISRVLAFCDGTEIRLRALYCQNIPDNIEVGETISFNTWAFGIETTQL